MSGCGWPLADAAGHRDVRFWGLERRPRQASGAGLLERADLLSFGLHIRGLGAYGEGQFANLVLQIGGRPHKSGREVGVGSCSCHFEQRCRRFTCVEVVLRHGYSRLTLLLLMQHKQRGKIPFRSESTKLYRATVPCRVSAIGANPSCSNDGVLHNWKVPGDDEEQHHGTIKPCCDRRAIGLRRKFPKMPQLWLGGENVLACLRQGLSQKGFLQLLLR